MNCCTFGNLEFGALQLHILKKSFMNFSPLKVRDFLLEFLTYLDLPEGTLELLNHNL